MKNNVIRAILNIFSWNNFDLKEYSSQSKIRINAVGEQLEFFLKDSLANSFSFSSTRKLEIFSAVFSWMGNQNHPPDFIIRGGDAFEVKKIQSLKASLALNSSPPKNKLLSSDPRITRECKDCENGWVEKDLFYVVGNVKSSKIKYIFFVHGLCYAGNHEIYEKIQNPIKEGISHVLSDLGLEKKATAEFGKLKKVDPLGITELRIRGMWHIRNPLDVFSNWCDISEERKFHLFAILKKEKYLTFPKKDRLELEKHPKIITKDIRINNPNNPAMLLDAKLIIGVEQ